MKKKMIAGCLLAVMVLSQVACGSKDDPSETTTTSQTESTTLASSETTTETTTEATSEESTEETTSGSGDVVSSGDEALDQAHQAAKDVLGENYIPSMPLDSAQLEELYGLDPTWYDAIIAEGPMMSTHVETFIGVHAKEGSLENIQKALQNYHEGLKSDTLQYPMSIPKIQGATVETIGDYVFFIMLGNSESEDEAAAIEECKNLNSSVVEKIKEIIE